MILKKLRPDLLKVNVFKKESQIIKELNGYEGK